MRDSLKRCICNPYTEWCSLAVLEILAVCLVEAGREGLSRVTNAVMTGVEQHAKIAAASALISV